MPRMKKRVLFATICLCATFAVALSAQRPADAPATAPAGQAPDSVFIEDLTWAEVRDLIAAGTTNVIVGTAGTEQKGPHMVDGEHKFVMEWAADKIARGMGKTLVAPVVTYVPEGSWENIGGHMAKPGTITLPEDRFVELLVNAGRSLKAGGFKKIWFLGESGGNRTGMRTAAEKLNALWNGAATAYWVDDYYTKAHAEQNTWAAKFLKVGDDRGRQPRQHPRHLGTDVRRAEAHSPGSTDRQRLSEQRRQRQQPGEVDARGRQGAAADQARSRARADQADERRRRAAGGRGAGPAGWRTRRTGRRPAAADRVHSSRR